MKLEVGMFVRTKNGIGKITDFEEDLINIDLDYRTVIDYKSELFDITKASFNLIDLIEVGDYVNGYKVISKPFYDSGYITFGLSNNTNFDSLCEIKEVLTHEQYEANVYKVGE